MGDAIHDAAKAKTAHENRIEYLLRRRPDGGMGLEEDAPSVVDERKKLERASNERRRPQELSDVRSARWTVCKRLETSGIDWILRGGIPANCVLDVFEDAPVAELLKKGERIADAVERHRHRLRELAADRHRVNSSPWPSSVAKEKAKATILALAERGAPLLDSMVENGSPLAFNTVSMQAMVHGTETPAMNFIEGAPDSLGLICWLLRDQMLAKINAAIDEVADDKQALSQQQRDIAESEIGNSVLMIERAECALIWHAEAAGEVIVFVAARARRRYSAFSFERLRASAPTDRAAITPSTLCIPPSNSGDERIRIVAEPAAS